MFDWPQAPHEDHEKDAFRWFVTFIAGQILLQLLTSPSGPTALVLDAAQGLGVFLMAGSLFTFAYWLLVVVLRRLPSDAELLQPSVDDYREPAEWGPILDAIANVRALSPRDRQRLSRMIGRFLDHVIFEGCNGLVLNDHIRVTIAAQACLRALDLPRGAFGPLKHVLVYPTTFLPKRFEWATSTSETKAEATLGESWHRGTVILAWDDVLRGVEVPTDGHNVALHEFAHQLDSASGAANGIPQLGAGQRYAAWTSVLEESFARFSRQVRTGRKTAIDAYGATNEAEFFAVATETFFERPKQLQHEYPELYGQLLKYYRQDPSDR